MRGRRSPHFVRSTALGLACFALSSCSDEPESVPLSSSRAYKGHENDNDANNADTLNAFGAAYLAAGRDKTDLADNILFANFQVEF